MSGLKDIATSRGTVYKVPYSKLIIDKDFNVRDDFGDIDELAKLIAENGQKTPMQVRLSDDGKNVIIVDGHRRYEAIEIANKKYGAKISDVSCINEERGANEESRIVDMFVYGSGKPLTLLEQAKVIKKLMDYNWKATDIAKKIGKTQAYVSQLLNLQGASHVLREAVKKGIVSPTAAIKLSTVPISQQKSVLAKVSALGLDGNGKTKVKVKDVEKATKGMPSTVSTKKIKVILSSVNDRIKQKDTEKNWNDVKYGLELALGTKKL